MSDGLYTPYLNEEEAKKYGRGLRAFLELNSADLAKVDKRGGWGLSLTATAWGPELVTDQLTGRRLYIKGCECPLPGCFCGAVIVGEETDGKHN